MQRLYSMFPQGGPGVGLLFLRIATAGMFALNVTYRFNFGSSLIRGALVSLIAIISLSLCIGFLTPILSIIVSAIAVANLLFSDQPNVVCIVRILTSVALVFLGPGGYSLDAKLFGLRVTVVPPGNTDYP
jgi:hypothetical protein